MSIAHRFKDKTRTDDVLISESVDFSGLLLSNHILEGLTEAGFRRPSPIQLKAIPLGRCGLDLIVQAKSGTGKTCVFTVVALESLELKSVCVQVLVLAPTREIAIQIQEVIQTIGRPLKGLKCHTFIGGLPLNVDKTVVKNCHIAIGTPGRIKQLIELEALKTTNIRLFVLDEADKLLEGDFQGAINWIFSKLPENKQILALSATYPELLLQHLTIYMRNPTFVRLNITDPALLGIKQYHVVVPNHPMPNIVFKAKTEVIVKILSSVSFQQCLIFSNLQTRAQNLQSELQSRNWPTACIAGQLNQKERNHAMEQLKTYKCRILISTDLTSRGIDADKVNLVINLDVPYDHETYLHRIGRAGRFGSFGAAITIVSKDGQDADLWAVERKCKTHIHKLPDPIPHDLVTKPLPVRIDDVVSTEQMINKPSPDLGVPLSNGSYQSQETNSSSYSQLSDQHNQSLVDKVFDNKSKNVQSFNPTLSREEMVEDITESVPLPVIDVPGSHTWQHTYSSEDDLEELSKSGSLHLNDSPMLAGKPKLLADAHVELTETDLLSSREIDKSDSLPLLVGDGSRNLAASTQELCHSSHKPESRNEVLENQDYFKGNILESNDVKAGEPVNSALIPSGGDSKTSGSNDSSYLSEVSELQAEMVTLNRYSDLAHVAKASEKCPEPRLSCLGGGGLVCAGAGRPEGSDDNITSKDSDPLPDIIGNFDANSENEGLDSNNQQHYNKENQKDIIDSLLDNCVFNTEISEIIENQVFKPSDVLECRKRENMNSAYNESDNDPVCNEGHNKIDSECIISDNMIDSKCKESKTIEIAGSSLVNEQDKLKPTQKVEVYADNISKEVFTAVLSMLKTELVPSSLVNPTIKEDTASNCIQPACSDNSSTGLSEELACTSHSIDRINTACEDITFVQTETISEKLNSLSNKELPAPASIDMDNDSQSSCRETLKTTNIKISNKRISVRPTTDTKRIGQRGLLRSFALSGFLQRVNDDLCSLNAKRIPSLEDLGEKDDRDFDFSLACNTTMPGSVPDDLKGCGDFIDKSCSLSSSERNSTSKMSGVSNVNSDYLGNKLPVESVATGDCIRLAEVTEKSKLSKSDVSDDLIGESFLTNKVTILNSSTSSHLVDLKKHSAPDHNQPVSYEKGVPETVASTGSTPAGATILEHDPNSDSFCSSQVLSQPTKTLSAYFSSLLMSSHYNQSPRRLTDLESDHLKFCTDFEQLSMSTSCPSELMKNLMVENVEDPKEFQNVLASEAAKLSMLKSKFQEKLLHAHEEKATQQIKAHSTLRYGISEGHLTYLKKASLPDTVQPQEGKAGKKQEHPGDQVFHEKSLARKGRKGRGKGKHFKGSDSLNCRRDCVDVDKDLNLSSVKDIHSEWFEKNDKSCVNVRLEQETCNKELLTKSTPVSRAPFSGHEPLLNQKVENNKKYSILNETQNSKQERHRDRKTEGLKKEHTEYGNVKTKGMDLDNAVQQKDDECKILDNMHAQMLQRRRERKLGMKNVHGGEIVPIADVSGEETFTKFTENAAKLVDSQSYVKKSSGKLNKDSTGKVGFFVEKENIQVQGQKRNKDSLAVKMNSTGPGDTENTHSADHDKGNKKGGSTHGKQYERSQMGKGDDSKSSLLNKGPSEQRVVESKQLLKPNQLQNSSADHNESFKKIQSKQKEAEIVTLNQLQNSSIDQRTALCSKQTAAKSDRQLPNSQVDQMRASKIIIKSFKTDEIRSSKMAQTRSPKTDEIKSSKTSKAGGGPKDTDASTSSTSDLSLSSASDISDINSSDVDSKDIILASQCYANKYAHDGSGDTRDGRFSSKKEVAKKTSVNCAIKKQHNHGKYFQQTKSKPELDDFQVYDISPKEYAMSDMFTRKHSTNFPPDTQPAPSSYNQSSDVDSLTGFPTPSITDLKNAKLGIKHRPVEPNQNYQLESSHPHTFKYKRERSERHRKMQDHSEHYHKRQNYGYNHSSTMQTERFEDSKSEDEYFSDGCMDYLCNSLYMQNQHQPNSDFPQREYPQLYSHPEATSWFQPPSRMLPQLYPHQEATSWSQPLSHTSCSMWQYGYSAQPNNNTPQALSQRYYTPQPRMMPYTDLPTYHSSQAYQPNNVPMHPSQVMWTYISHMTKMLLYLSKKHRQSTIMQKDELNKNFKKRTSRHI